MLLSQERTEGIIDQLLGTATQIYAIVGGHLHRYDSPTQSMISMQEFGLVQLHSSCATHIITVHQLPTTTNTDPPRYNVYAHGWVPSPTNDADPEAFTHTEHIQKPMLVAENISDLLAVGCGQGFSVLVTGTALEQ